MKTDADHPWVSIIDMSKIRTNVDMKDGWGHMHHDAESEASILRELEGVTANDKHEQVMKQFYDAQIENANREYEEIIQEVGQSQTRDISYSSRELSDQEMREIDEEESLRRERRSSMAVSEIRAAELAEERKQERIRISNTSSTPPIDYGIID